jgi:phosphotransferase system HPr-like phosphotransfer protein
MQEISVRLTSLDDVKAFVDAATAVDCQVEVIDGDLSVNARSIKDILDLNLHRPLRVAIIGATSAVESFCTTVSHMIVVPV